MIIIVSMVTILTIMIIMQNKAVLQVFAVEIGARGCLCHPMYDVSVIVSCSMLTAYMIVTTIEIGMVTRTVMYVLCMLHDTLNAIDYIGTYKQSHDPISTANTCKTTLFH